MPESWTSCPRFTLGLHLRPPQSHQGYSKVVPSYTQATPGVHRGYARVTHRLRPGGTPITPGSHLHCNRGHQSYTKVTAKLSQVTPKLFPSYTRVAPGLRQGCAQDTPRWYPGNALDIPWSHPWLHPGCAWVTPNANAQPGHVQVTPKYHADDTSLCRWHGR